MKTILLVVSNPTVSSTTQWPVGFWLSELTHPLETFQKHGYHVTIASPDGGKVDWDALSDPTDPSGYSAHDQLSLSYRDNPEFLTRLSTTPRIDDLDLTGFDAILVAGGQAPMFTFEQATSLHEAFIAFYGAGKPSAALCHGTSLLLYLKDGARPFVKDKRMTGFTNAEEDLADQATGMRVMPFRIEEEAKRLGAVFVSASPWTPFSVVDGHLITGQQQESGQEVAMRVIEFLEA